MLDVEEMPYGDVMRDFFKRMGYAPVSFESPGPMQLPGSVRSLTKRERRRVDSLSKERGYRRFHAFGRAR